ncbi:GntR family transcriptional regulator [Nocardioides sp. Root122]|uniref:GntR family transcriptional regulator n=1 Tax=Nocardioides TaxID=1839 RepID=UPI000702D469|nr:MULTISPECIES: GntR family transcriptional regulator [Nocardioides]KQV71322.1 GntR family transcriptional regulator [Nocardioides sp. Root122]MCK9822723.1 GntR family transcriptional regulator [Nocardioides cavernae]
MASSAWVEELSGERAALTRASTAGRVAEILRSRITEGRLPPGTRLSEEDIGVALGVSRNTLREAFRLLAHERLLVHEFNRGVFVRRLTVDDVHDLYRFRRLVEGGVLRTTSADAPLDDVRRAVEEGESAAAGGRWVDVGTANMRFHQAVAALAGSPRVEESMRHVLAELRLVFHVMAAPRTFHEPYLAENRRILDLLESGDVAGAAETLERYLTAAEAQLTEAYAATGC